MHIKFLARGTGSAREAANYLLGERDAAGKPREGVEVLRGNPDMVAAVADSLDFEHRYTSGVIAWAPDDQPTDEHIESVVDEFEKTAWAGLEPDRYAWTAVLTVKRATAPMSTSSRRDAIWRPGGASTSPLRDGGRRSIRSGTPSTTSMAGLVPTTRRGPGSSNPVTAPTSKRHSCGPGSDSKPPPAT